MLTMEQLPLPGLMTGKKCVKCNEWKSLGEYHKRKTGKDGLRSECKQCRSAYQRSYHAERREEHNAQMRLYNEAHREELNAKQRVYYAANRVEIAAKNAIYHDANRDKRNARSRVYHAVYYAEHREKVLARCKRYRVATPEKTKLWGQRHRARKSGIPGSYTSEEWLDLCIQYDTCPCCNKPWSEVGNPTEDHVIPITWAGSTNDITNIQPLCKSCNSAKGNRHATDYRHPQSPIPFYSTNPPSQIPALT